MSVTLRRDLFYVVGTVSCVALMLGGIFAASSSARESWSYHLNSVACRDSTLLATAPLGGQYGNVTSWFGGRETVYWRSQLQKKSGSGGWYLINNRQPWLKGVANAAGILPFNLGGTYYWVNSRDNLILEHHTYVNLPAGTYRVKEYFYWPRSGVTKVGYPNRYNNQSATACRFS